MEGRRIPILENFAIISIIMPYYSFSHNGFLLLSTLCTKSRSKLDEFYEEFRNSMRNYCMKIISRINANWIYLPSDLFKFSISVNVEKDAKNMIWFISNLVSKKGNYFNKYYMSDKISVNKIVITFEFLEMFESYIESMRSIEVFFYEDTNVDEIENYKVKNLIESKHKSKYWSKIIKNLEDYSNNILCLFYFCQILLI